MLTWLLLWLLWLPPDGDFIYLGRIFNWNMNSTAAKSNIERKLHDLLNITDRFQLRAQGKLKIVTMYIHSQMMFELKTNDYSLTWIEQTLDAECFKFIRNWLELPVSACLKEQGRLGFQFI